MNCPKCGLDISDSDVFCGKCGINLREPKNGTNSGYTVSPKLYISGIGIILLCVIGFVGFKYWQSTPTYSLMQVEKATKMHDIDLFNKYVDVDSVVNVMIDDTMSSVQQDQKPKNQWEEMGQALATGIVGLVKQPMVNYVKKEVDRFIEKGSYDEDADQGNQKAPSISLKEIQGKIGNEFKRRISTRVEGKLAFMKIAIFNARLGREIPLELKFRKKEGNYWQIIEVQNLIETLKNVTKIEQQMLFEKNKAIISKMSGIVVCGKVKKSSITDYWGINKTIVIEIPIKNGSTGKINNITLHLSCNNMKGDLIKEMNLDNNNQIKPQEQVNVKWQINANSFDNNDIALYEGSQNEMQYEVHPVSVELDGNRMEIATSL